MGFRGGGARRAHWLAVVALAGCVGPTDPSSAGSFGSGDRKPFAASEEPSHGQAAEEPMGAPQGAAVPVPAIVVPDEAVASRAAVSEHVAAVGSPGGTVSEPSPAATEVGVEAGGDRSKERALRNAFADAGDVTEPALQLASFLVRKERYPEALHVLDLAIGRSRDDERPAPAGLRLARAGLLRDVARNDLAMVELRGVVRERGRERVAAGTLLELAQVEWLAGERDAAKATMRDLLRVHVDRPFLRDNAAWVREWRNRIENQSVTDDSGDLRDAFALLRAAPLVTGRIRILDALARPQASGPDDGRREVRLLAIKIACADESAAVRTRAVQLADANGVDNLPFWRAAMADEAPLVRRYGAYGAVRRHGERAVDAVLAAMAAEQDPATFAALHAAMAKALDVAPPPCADENEEGRANAVAMWRKRCGR